MEAVKSIVRSELSQPICLAVLKNNGKYVMQLRDNKPDINAPGQWGIFGGYRNKAELPEAAILREIKEELNIETKASFCFVYLWANVFHADISEHYGSIVLKEGQGFGSFSLDELCEMNTAPHAIRILTTYEKWK